MPDIRVVTDSAADLPPEVAAARGIRVVPLTITFGEESFLDGVELPADRFWDKLRGGVTPTTAAPSQGDFQELYRSLLDEGATGIVSVHLSSKLSATYQAAAKGAEALAAVSGNGAAGGAPPIIVFDSLGVSAATALLAERAVDLASQGSDLHAIATDLAAYRQRMHLYATVDTLEYLRRGGRIGGAQALLGTMLQFKPVISLQDGVVEASGRVRTRQKALHHLAALVRPHAGNLERVIVINGQAQDLPAFLDALRATVDVPPRDVWSFGPVVGTHTGPGVIGVVFVTRS